MAGKNILDKLSPEQATLNVRIFNLILSRVLKRIYLGLDEASRKKMEEVFISDDDKEKEKFTKKYMPDFKVIFEEESRKIEEELKLEIEKQI